MATSDEKLRQSILEEAKAEYKARLEDHLIVMFKASRARGTNEAWWREIHPAVVQLLKE